MLWRADTPAVTVRSDNWEFFTNHTHVLVCLAGEPELRLRDVAARVGVTERAAHDLVKDLERAGYVQVRKVGRRNRYEVCGELPLRRFPFERRNAGELISLASPGNVPAASATTRGIASA